MFSNFFHKKSCNSVDPECTVTFGVTIEAALHHKNSDLNSKPNEIVGRDITSHWLGTEVENNKMSVP